MTETNNSNIIKRNRVKNLNWPEAKPVGYVVEDLNSGLATVNKSSYWSELDLASELQVQRSNRSASLPPLDFPRTYLVHILCNNKPVLRGHF